MWETWVQPFSWEGRSPRGGHGNPFQCSCLENSHGQRNLVGYSPWDCKESDMTEQLSTAQHIYIYHYIYYIICMIYMIYYDIYYIICIIYYDIYHIYDISYYISFYIYIKWNAITGLQDIYAHFKWNLKQFSKCLYQFTLSPAVYESSSYSTSSPILGIVWLLIFVHFVGCVMVSYYDLNLYFSDNNVEQTIEYLFKSFAHFSIRSLIFCSLILRSLYTLRIWYFVQICIMISISYSLSFHFCNSILNIVLIFLTATLYSFNLEKDSNFKCHDNIEFSKKVFGFLHKIIQENPSKLFG